MHKIKVKPEGRDGVYTCEKEDIIEWLEKGDIDTIHNFRGNSASMFIGADWEKSSVIETINKSDRIAILTGSALANNLRHGLSVVTGNRLEMFDIGEITDDDLDVQES